MLSPLLNFKFVLNLSKISYNTNGLGMNCGLRRKFSHQIWKEKTKEVTQMRGEIMLIENEESWEKASSIILRDVETVNAVGFDCEWLQRKGIRKPVALMQLATFSGNCFLFRLNYLQKSIPPSLQEILENRKILKVGVACHLDVSNFAEDYNVNVKGWLDLRHLAIEDNLKNCKIGLKSLSSHYLGKTLLKNWKLRASDWESSTLSEEQVKYAAEDALVGIHVFLTQLKNLWEPSLEESWETSVRKAIEEVCHSYVEVEFDNEKERFCFICGKNEVSSCKNVVPKEYRKYFPPIPELRSQRYLISLCNRCEENYCFQEEALRQKLAEECDAPIGKVADAENIVEKKLKAVNAARVLKEGYYRLSLNRLVYLETILKDFYETETITEDLINQTVCMHEETQSEKLNLHGFKVFSYFEKSGLIHLLTQCRQWFLDSMKPKYLPKDWAISYDLEELEFKIKMSQFPMDSDIRDLYKLILVGKDGNIDVIYQPDEKARGIGCSSSDPNVNLTSESELNLSPTEELIDQTYEKR